MKMRSVVAIATSITSVCVLAQEQDSLHYTQNLETVILTGQYSPQSVDKSVFEVEVLTQEDLKRMAGNTLDDVLTQTLNLSVIPNSGEGRSGIQQFGFDSQYIKILIDGVPVIGDEGFGNAIDISQISLDDIQQIEIIEGAMGVQFGANAVTGVVNIITKKSSKKSWQIRPYIQEETVGNEYNWSDKGRHIQSIKVGHKFSKNWYSELSYIHNDFQGFWGQKQGKNYANPNNASDGLRGYEWLPKEQHTAKALLNYNGQNIHAFYKFEYFHEQTDKYAYNVNLNPNNSTQTMHPTAQDKIFRTNRHYHHLNLNGNLGQQMRFNVSASYQQQKRNQESFTYHLRSGQKSEINRYDYNSREGIFSNGSLNRIINSDWINFEVGYEINLDNGFASGLAEQNSTIDSEKKRINVYSGFTSAEIQLGEKLSIRPGFRYLHSNKFDDQYVLSFSGKYEFGNDYELRAILGTAPKLPNFEELYFYFVDANHDVRGNENLTPEKGKSAFLHLKKKFHFNNEISYQPKLSAWYLDVDDKIDLIIVNTSPLAYQYANIDLYKTWGLALRNKFAYRQFTAGLGIGLSGESKVLNSAETYNDDFLYAIQLNSEISYQLPKWNTIFSAYFKYNGPTYQFVSVFDNEMNAQIVREKQEAYAWLNASIKQNLFKDKLEITLGARNLLNVKEIRTTTQSDGHNTPSNSILMGYDSSYFIKLQYNLDF